jgi:hypothetical protein
MEVNKKARSSSISKEKILLASIPVIGSIVIALVANQNMKCNPRTEAASINTISLKNLAGKVDDIVMFENYNDLFSMLSEGLKPTLTRELFKSVNDSMKTVLGDFIKPIDTTKSSVNGLDVYYVKNQHQKGQSLISVAFDNNRKIVHLLYGRIPQ